MIETEGIKKFCLAPNAWLSGFLFIGLGPMLASSAFGSNWVWFGISCALFLIGVSVFVVESVSMHTTSKGIYSKKVLNNPKQQPILWSDINSIYQIRQDTARGFKNYYVLISVKNRAKYFPKTKERDRNAPVLRLSVSKNSNLEQRLKAQWEQYK